MFEYFPENYVWSVAVVQAVHLGGAISEIDEACRPLREASVRNDNRAQQEWLESWKKAAERVEELARSHEEAGQHLSAGRKYLRASIYYFMAERMCSRMEARKFQTYKQGLRVFKKAMLYRREVLEWVEVPFKGKSLPALFVPGLGEGRRPCMVHFDGFDWLKEFLYIQTAREYRARGISLLIVDHPGVGEALRLRGLHSDEKTEVPAAACVDYLQTRPDVAPDRIGMVALSLGGYYAPRAAAFEKRFKACVAWSANWDRWELNEKYLQKFSGSGKSLQASLPNYVDQYLWVAGKDTVEEAIELAKKYTLEGVADKITCPLLVIHGENDRQVPLSHAERTVAAAVNSPNRKLKILTLAEGGAEHCAVDNDTIVVDYITDWVAQTLEGNPKGV